VEGASYEDAAQEMGVSVGTIRSHLSRARSYLREQVAGRIRPAYQCSRDADVRVENTRHYRIRLIERHAACPEDAPAKQTERDEHSRTPAETTLAYPLAGTSNAATCKIPKPPRVVEVTVEKSGRILLTGAGFPRALPGEAANDYGNLRISGLAAEQVGSRGPDGFPMFQPSLSSLPINGLFRNGRSYTMPGDLITIVGAALLTLAAASADAQQTKEMLTHDPNVLQSLEPNPAPQGTRSPDTIDRTDDESGLPEALDHLKNDPVDVQGHDVEQRAKVPDADEPREQAR
jgi:hypothetical protein